ncbi:50S ribosomal protein L22 [bacterium]|nr:50S ribosomal protein L22 [bacterium]
MKTTAIVRNVHVSSRKAKLVVDLIRGKKVAEAIRILDTTNKKSARILKKLLNSAIANATNNHSMNGQFLYVYEVFANEGVTMKRIMQRAKGSADTIFKRTTHFQITLSDDPSERQKDLEMIKQKIKKRAEGNRKKDVEHSKYIDHSVAKNNTSTNNKKSQVTKKPNNAKPPVKDKPTVTKKTAEKPNDKTINNQIKNKE